MAIKKAERKSNAGRPTDYREEYAEQAYKLSLLKATQEEMADFFGVAVSTFSKWKLEIQEFSEALSAGKMKADMNVANSLYHSTMDRVVVEKRAIKLKEVYYDENGKRHEKETIEYVDEERAVPGDFKAQSLWLRNRHPDKWREQQHIDNTTNGENINMINLGGGVTTD